MGIKQFDVMNLGRAGLIKPEQLGYRDSLEIIKDESFRIQKSFVKIGWYLKHIRDNELYKEDGYANVWECASDQLGYSQPTASRFINICEKFSKGHDSPELDEKYAGFDKSQMIEMLPMEPGQLARVTPDMTVRQIRDIKAEKKTPGEEPQPPAGDSIPGQTSLEEDFPEYLPEEQPADPEGDRTEPHATPHKENPATGKIVDGEYREIKEPEEKAVMPHPPDAHEMKVQPVLPALKNNDMRKEWLNNYKEWGLWYRDENIDVNYYKYDFEDGSRLVVAEYLQRYKYWNNERSDEHYFHLLEKNKKGYKITYDEQYQHQNDSETYLTDFLKNIQGGRKKQA